MDRIYFATIFAALLAFLFYGAGCTRRSLDASDGGAGDMASVCGTRTIANCESDPRCVIQPGCCGSGSRCVADGTPEPACTCPLDCKSLDESSCTATGGTCIADYCYECSCVPTFVGCRLASDPVTQCPGLGCPQPLCQCDGLSEGACLAAEKTLGCTATYCPDCHGGQVFSSCLGPNSGAGACPASCPAETCHNPNDCSGGQECLAPGAPVCGGACLQMPCSSDGQCGAGEVCDLAPCSCTNSGKACVAGCSQAGCPEGQTCGNDDHCLPTTCNNTNQCPKFFSCIFPPGPGNPHCQRLGCASDSNCVGGFCVEGACYSSLGSCMFPAP